MIIKRNDMFTIIVLFALVVVCVARWNDRRDYLQEKKVLFNKIEVYETQINEREVKEDSLRSLILSKDIRIDSINNIVKKKDSIVTNLKKKLDDFDHKKYSDISDNELVDVLSNIKFKTSN